MFINKHLNIFILLQFTIVFVSAQNNISNIRPSIDTKLRTIEIQSKIDELHEKGGGELIFTKGEYLTGSIILKDNVSIELKKGAVLLGSTNPRDYKSLNRWKALILAENSNNINIVGNGTINGRGRQLALHIDSLFYIDKIDSTDYNFVEKRPKYTIRPQIIEFVNCKNVTIKDITIKNAACWVQSYDRCDGLLIDNIRVDSDAYWNNDGIDIIDSKNVVISNSNINASDDGICLKSSIDNSKIGNFYCENILIKNCKVRSSASAVKLGSRSVGGFKNITIENIRIKDTYRSAIALEVVDGGIMQNIRVKNVRAKNVGNAFFIRLGQRYRKSVTLSKIEGIFIEDMKVKIADNRPDKKHQIKGPDLAFFHNPFPASITGIDSQSAAQITLRKIKISYPGNAVKAYAHFPLEHLDKIPELPRAYPEFSMFGELPAWGIYIRHVKKLELEEVTLKLRKKDFRKAIVLDKVHDIQLKNVRFQGYKLENPIHQHKSTSVHIAN